MVRIAALALSVVSALANDCSVYSIGDGKCGESTLNCLYVGPAKAFNKALKDGTCADQGYTVATGETQKQSTPVGDIIITFYTQALEATKDCTVYSIGDGKCGESTLNCLYVGPAKAFNKALQDGTCADQGYTVATGETQKQSTPVGDIIITFYTQALEAMAMQCPGSSAGVHCGMELTTTAAASCSTVQEEIEARLAGVNGWYDQHNRGTYTKQSYGGAVSASRLTGDGKYTDKMVFSLTDQDGSCKIEACSESQVFSIGDAGTNYCNVKLLVCGSDQGCKVAKNDFTLGSEQTSKKAQASVNMGACLAATHVV